MADAGAPEGVYSNLFLQVSDVERVVSHPAVQGTSMTAAATRRRLLAEISGRHLKKCVLELGGSDPFVVLDVDDLDAFSMRRRGDDSATPARVALPPNRSSSGRRYDEFVEGLTAGSPTRRRRSSDPQKTLGPLSSEDAARKLLEQVDDAVAKGATVTVGGNTSGRPGAGPENGRRRRNTCSRGVTPDMRAFEEELFGPVAVCLPGGRRGRGGGSSANSTRFGLGGTVSARTRRGLAPSRSHQERDG
ncbi:aldehyde dehydrogenase family protein, partial [Rhodococcus hoagii]|nr:aldehyde dehydrogenase family protein [Prescottella equi]